MPEIAAVEMVHDKQQRGASSLSNVQPEPGEVFLTLERQLFLARIPKIDMTGINNVQRLRLPLFSDKLPGVYSPP